MQIFEDSDEHCYGHTDSKGLLPMRIKYGPYIQLAGTHQDCHTINLRDADKWSRPKDEGVITLERRPAKGEPYHLRFVVQGTTQEEEGEDLLHNWLLPRIREQQRAVMRRLELPEDAIDPILNSASTSHDGAGSLLKAVRKWIATDFGKPGKLIIL